MSGEPVSIDVGDVMRVDLIKWRKALRHPQGPNPIVRHVLLTLATWGNSEGDSMFPSIEVLAKATGRSRNTVAQALSDAANDGWVWREARPGPYGKPRYSYEATVPADWANINDLDHRWETDSTWVSERRARGRLKAKRYAEVPQPQEDTRVGVPHSQGDCRSVSHSDVPQLANKCPPISSVVSPNSARHVPLPQRITSSETSSKTNSREGRALTRNDARADVESKPMAGRTLEKGLRYASALIERGEDPRVALSEATRAGYPITAEALEAHLKSKQCA